MWQRKKLLIVAGVVLVALTAVVIADRASSIGDSAESVARSTPTVFVARLDMTMPERPKAPAASGKLFGASIEKPPVRPTTVVVQAPPPTPPSPPSAPALPFTYLGRMVEKGELRVFLAAGGETYVAKKGDVILDVYRIEAVSENNIEFNYLPMNERQALSVAPAQ